MHRRASSSYAVFSPFLLLFDVPSLLVNALERAPLIYVAGDVPDAQNPRHGQKISVGQGLSCMPHTDKAWKFGARRCLSAPHH